MRTDNVFRNLIIRTHSLVLIGVFMLLAVAVAVPFYSAQSSSLSPRDVSSGTSLSAATATTQGSMAGSAFKSMHLASSIFFPTVPPSGSASVATFAADCSTPQTLFHPNDTVCAHVTGATSGWELIWSNADFVAVQTNPISSDPQDITFTLSANPSLGDWRVIVYDQFGGNVEAVSIFTVSNPANPLVDVQVVKSALSPTTSPGSQLSFGIQVSNGGPDTAQNIVLTDGMPANTTFNSFLQTSGPTFSCTTPAAGETGTITCTRDSLARGDSAIFVLQTTVSAGAVVGTQISNTATVSNDIADSNNDNNSSTASANVQSTSSGGGTGSTCSVACPDDVFTQASTTQNGQDGAIVHFSTPSGNTECGTITVSHCNDCFFPVGQTTVTATASTGESCSFVVTVQPAQTGGTTISCPANQSGNADSNCQASFNLGTATATGTNVTVYATRSDGQLVYNCDAFGNCTRTSSDGPFTYGDTTITWYAFSHDIPGPYDATTGDEESRRTGTASCTQTITVNDVTPPTIAATNSTASADANCQAAVPDFSNTVTDNCSTNISYTQTPAAGTLEGLGTYTVHITANDNSSNNGGAGNTSTKDITFTVNDTTPPSFTFVPSSITTSTGPGATTCGVTLDPGTATASDNCGPVTITRTPSGNVFAVGTTTITWTAKDGANNTTTATQTVTVIDNTPPVISCPANIVVYLPLNTTATSMPVSYAATATDNCGVANIGYSIAPGSSFSVGTTAVTATATDVNGNTASCTFTVTVLYDFSGFFSPVANPPTLNVVKAGSGVPVKFSLSGNKGLTIFAVGSPASQQINCASDAPLSLLIGTVTAGSSSLNYDATSDQYSYIWKTDSSWAGTCRQLSVTLNDGSVHVANFSFK